MKPRLDAWKVAPGVLKAMLRSAGPRQQFRAREEPAGTGEDPRLADQRLRLLPAHAHARCARGRRDRGALYLLDAWRESPLYTERERAALAWTEALTLVADTRAPDADYEVLRRHFTEEERSNLTLLITTINTWNRFNVGFRAVHPMAAKHAAAA